jgi:hypothetical protein
MSEENKEENKNQNDNKFKSIIDNDNLVEIKGVLSKLKILLENKADNKLQEIIQLKQNLPHLIHLKRMMKMEQEKNNE